MRSSRTAIGLLSLTTLTSATYTQTAKYDPTNFFQKFEFFSGPDPTNGFVSYKDAHTADSSSLAGFANGGIYLGADYTNTTTTGRASTRVTSVDTFTKGLFIADIAHMPAGVGAGGSCGIWPAFWMFGPNWPTSGEIDILEGVNNQATNALTLHTAPGCHMTRLDSIPAGTQLMNADCQGNLGCPQHSDHAASYGSAFNAAGGGVYAVEWTSAAISIWFFPRSSELISQALGENPDPAAFGVPLAVFAASESCDIDQHFANHQIVFNTDFCGDWAGKVWDQDDTCRSVAPTCEEYVGQNPAAFVEAYWLINSVRVFQQTAPVKREVKFSA